MTGRLRSPAEIYDSVEVRPLEPLLTVLAPLIVRTHREVLHGCASPTKDTFDVLRRSDPYVAIPRSWSSCVREHLCHSMSLCAHELRSPQWRRHTALDCVEQRAISSVTQQIQDVPLVSVRPGHGCTAVERCRDLQLVRGAIDAYLDVRFTPRGASCGAVGRHIDGQTTADGRERFGRHVVTTG